MPKEKLKIEFSETDIKELIAEKYNLNKHSTTIRIYQYNGDMREPSYTTITVEGERNPIIL
jgi:hypothetical protein